ncbi:MAG: malto-oligosyltrehalose synthase, partial [Streptosporangiales bacterium]|nr:malto-oligosyltrehalose synthase [Streptosporangiales bacterium]
MAPTSTYRLQLNAEFGFHEAAAVVPYLASLGVSHAYLSPILEAAPGSTHGYDVVDHSRLSGERGGVEGWRVLQGALREHGLGCVVDVVPNHMAIPAPESVNPALWAVLRDGRTSEYAHWFDVDWAAGDGRLVLPVLGTDVDEAVATGELKRDGDRLVYHDHEFPVSPATAGLPTGELVHAQHYTLVSWEATADRLDYRRFFDVSGLIGLRVEDEDVFERTHRLLFELVAAGDVQGLRIDHPDGLADPRGYLDRLRAAAPEAWIVVEKILGTGETLPLDWPCDGSTGYDALPVVETALLDRHGADGLVAQHARLTGAAQTYPETVAAAKRGVLAEVLTPERRRLTGLLARCLPDSDAGQLGDALDALLVAMPVYRTYLVPGRPPGPADVAVLDRARDAAALARPAVASVLDRVVDLLLGRARPGADASVAELVIRFQQTSGALAAKGVEDTAFYRWLALPSLCEVGADPGHLEADPVGAFHRYAAEHAATSMTTLTTHDSKRAEDVRARLRLLAEIPDRWTEAVTRWRGLAGRAEGVDDRTDHLLWLTLVGAWPVSADRLTAYLTKACREAKLATSWLRPDEAYEHAVLAHAEAVLADPAVRDDVAGFVADLHEPWVTELLAAKLLQLTMPGVPDCYQGAEATRLVLVDPDNRGPVDYGTLAGALVDADAAAAPPGLVAGPDAAKVHLVSRTLRALRRRPGLFDGYQPLAAGGERADHVVAFSRGGAVTVVPRLPVALRAAGGWGDTSLELPPGEW